MKAKAPGQWWTKTWSPVTGCTPAGEGCRNCHALRKMRRHLPVLRGAGNADVPCSTVLCHPERLDVPARWKRPRVILAPMMGDLFHADVPSEFIRQVQDAMNAAQQHTYCLLTKRPLRASFFLEHPQSWPKRIILMASVWDQVSADEACAPFSKLRGVRWGLHCEPLLGPIRLPEWLVGHAVDCTVCGLRKNPRGRSAPLEMASGLCDHECPGYSQHPEPGWLWPGETQAEFGYGPSAPAWIVTGGENGPGARLMDPSWCLDLMIQCRAAGVAYWHKGHGDVVRRAMNKQGLTDTDPDNRLLDGEAWDQVPWNTDDEERPS